MSQSGDVSKYIPKPPRQVQADIATAEAIRAQMSGQTQPQEPAPQPAQPPQEPSPPPQSTPPPAQPTPPEPPPLAAQPPSGMEEDGQTWEQRARSAQGRYETQAVLNRQLNERLASMEAAIAAMTARGVEPPADPGTPPPAPLKPQLVTEQERADFGDDFLTVVGKRAKEEYAPEFEMLASRLKRLEGRLDGTVQLVTKSQQQDLYGLLDSQVENWRTINRFQPFKDWLEQLDPYSGRKRNDMLQDAFTRQEGPRVVSFFKGFLTEAAGPPSSQPNPSPTASSPNGATATPGGALTLEQLAAPGRARSAPNGPSVSPEKPVYTHAWIAQFMADKRTGKYRGRETDADMIERDIYIAQHEGRIRDR